MVGFGSAGCISLIAASGSMQRLSASPPNRVMSNGVPGPDGKGVVFVLVSVWLVSTRFRSVYATACHRQSFLTTNNERRNGARINVEIEAIHRIGVAARMRAAYLAGAFYQTEPSLLEHELLEVNHISPCWK